MKALRGAVTVLVLILSFTGARECFGGGTCTYTTYTWNTRLGRAVDYRTVVKPRSELTDEEVHRETGCTVCEEDMVWISVEGVEPVQVCSALAPALEAALVTAAEAGEHILNLVGRRVGRTKGPADEDGNRTKFSFHSYGIALDVNPDRNGLYTDCYTFGPQCRLLKGGRWREDQPGSITDDSVLVLEMKARGFGWGGEIQGRQKDFMHFSPSGY